MPFINTPVVERTITELSHMDEHEQVEVVETNVNAIQNSVLVFRLGISLVVGEDTNNGLALSAH